MDSEARRHPRVPSRLARKQRSSRMMNEAPSERSYDEREREVRGSRTGQTDDGERVPDAKRRRPRRTGRSHERGAPARRQRRVIAGAARVTRRSSRHTTPTDSAEGRWRPRHTRTMKRLTARLGSAQSTTAIGRAAWRDGSRARNRTATLRASPRKGARRHGCDSSPGARTRGASPAGEAREKSRSQPGSRYESSARVSARRKVSSAGSWLRPERGCCAATATRDKVPASSNPTPKRSARARRKS